MTAAKTKGPERFDLATVRKLAGAKTFDRGEEYFRDGSVEIISFGPKRVVAQVAGTEDYRTVLAGRGTNFEADCSCRAYMDWGFCKHIVAVALTVNAAGDGGEVEAAAALSRIRNHLKSKNTDQLVDIILDLAEQDVELFRRLEMQSAVTEVDDKTLESRMRKSIDAATRTGGYVDYRQAPGWAAGVDTALSGLADLASGPRADLALKLTLHAIDRIESALESIDDSEGDISALLDRTREIHLAAACAVRPDPIELARDLFKREMESRHDTFDGVLADFADLLGEQGLAEYRRLATLAWSKLSAKRGRTPAADDDFGSRLRLRFILDFFAKRDGDIDARIALRTDDLTSSWGYLQMAEFCLSLGREEQALRYAEDGLWQFEDGRVDDLLFLTVKLWLKAGRKDDAEAALWRAFQKAPSETIYKELRKIGGKAAAERALQWLESRLTAKANSPWNDRPDLLTRLLLNEKRFDAAWSIARKFPIALNVKQALVEATEVQYPREALEFYQPAVEQLVTYGSYPEAVKLIGRIAKLQTAKEQVTFVLNLKARHGRKRNLMKLLD